MKFIALPVKVGDAFLLEVNNQVVLIDSGEYSNECRDLLIKQDIAKLNIFICTHYDTDHINGLLPIIKSKIQVQEIWLPNIIGKINETVNDTSNSDIKQFLRNFIFNNNELIEEQYKSFCALCSASKNPEEFQSFKCKSLKYLNINNFILNKLFMISYELTQTQLKKISDIVNECKKRSIKIRWLKYIDNHIENEIVSPCNIYGLNCIETNNTAPFKTVEELLFYLTTINAESLVFKFCHDNYPNVLFCADSNFKFLEPGGNIILKDNSISTVAHHGANDNCKTFGLIGGANIIYVRSDSKNKFRPSKEYISLTNIKYCTICNQGINSKSTKLVNLLFKNGKWTSSSTKCTCQ
jgi:hypothetical protein